MEKERGYARNRWMISLNVLHAMELRLFCLMRPLTRDLEEVIYEELLDLVDSVDLSLDTIHGSPSP